MRFKLLLSNLVFAVGLVALAIVAAHEAQAAEAARPFSEDRSTTPFAEYAGLTFTALGPNCFSSATKITGVQNHFRGMDAPEFTAVVAEFCEPVDEPLMGDIGIYSIPNYGPIHAFVFISQNVGIQKPGVDYVGPTPINYVSMAAIDYTYGASAECRRYSQDVSECANTKSYVRCSQVSFTPDPALEQIDINLTTVETEQDAILLGTKPLELNVLGKLETEVYQQKKALLTVTEETKKSKLGKLLSAKLVSLEKQNQFLRQRADSETLVY